MNGCQSAATRAEGLAGTTPAALLPMPGWSVSPVRHLHLLIVYYSCSLQLGENGGLNRARKETLLQRMLRAAKEGSLLLV